MAPRDQRTRPAALYKWRLDRSRLRSEFHSRTADAVLAAAVGGWLVDVGCGPGHLGALLSSRDHGTRVVGVDIDPAMLEAASASRGLRVVLASADNLPFRDGACTAVVSTASLKDWANRSQGLAEIFRILQNGGRAFVFDFITVGPGSKPPGFVRRFGILSELLRRAMRIMIPFSMEEAKGLAHRLRERGATVTMDLEADIGVVKFVIEKSIVAGRDTAGVVISQNSLKDTGSPRI